MDVSTSMGRGEQLGTPGLFNCEEIHNVETADEYSR